MSGLKLHEIGTKPYNFGKCWNCNEHFEPKLIKQVYCSPCRGLDFDQYKPLENISCEVDQEHLEYTLERNSRLSQSAIRGWVTRKKREQAV